eukprot:GILI01003467.1.p1 GENE.GILI01003467.1~~GILI01003467.1.p1  ORF type:complete len:517 (+),score=158.39 GILI01003467.1:27-1553(+)
MHITPSSLLAFDQASFQPPSSSSPSSPDSPSPLHSMSDSHMVDVEAPYQELHDSTTSRFSRRTKHIFGVSALAFACVVGCVLIFYGSPSEVALKKKNIDIEPKWVRLPPTAPSQVHLALTSSISEMRAMWFTKDPTTTSTVKYGTASGAYTQMATGSAVVYSTEDLCASPARTSTWAKEVISHDVVMVGLKPYTKYFYIVGDDKGGWSKEHSFVSAPDSSIQQIKVVTIADLGNESAQPDSRDTVDGIVKDEIDSDLLIHIGDLSYAEGDAQQWDVFFDQIEPISSRMPYMVSPGNHEIGLEDSGGECGVPFDRRFHMPENGHGNNWYSFDYGFIHFVFMSTEHDFAQGSEQFKWLLNDLASVDRSRTPWVIFSGHRPMYSSNEAKEDTSERLRKEIEPMLISTKVDLALWGHVHSYERTCALERQQCMTNFNKDDELTVEGYPVHVVIGMAGKDESKWMRDSPKYSMERHRKHGYSKFVATRTKLEFSYIMNEDGKIHDKFTLRKKN